MTWELSGHDVGLVQTTSGATGWQVWPTPGEAGWCWSVHVNGVSESGTTSDAKLAREMANQAYGRLQDDARRRTLRSV